MVVQPSQATPSAAMAITIVVESLLFLSQSPLTNPLSGPLLSSQGGILHLGSPRKKARLISKEGSVHQSANPSIFHTELTKQPPALKSYNSCYLYKDFRINVKHSQLKQSNLRWYE